ncbi:glycosyltransferase [Dactylosporangium sp. CA-092794]|uniref:glycosyltransferase n=1 Tax=Dactylosporangium sp. CA-092794 TaxID=3239929 RepID=UPI003D8BF013
MHTDDGPDWVVLFSGTPWRGGAHRQHALARELAATRRVLFVDPPGLRPRLRLTVRPVGERLWHAVVPTVLPLVRHLPPANRLARVAAAAALRRWLDRRPARRVLWLDEDLAAPVAGRVGESAVVYDAADLDWTFTRPWNRRHLRAGLRAAVGAADLVIASSSALPERLPPARRAPAVLANGCDPDLFTPDGATLPRLAGLPRPLLGYAGAIDRRAFDAELVAAVARDHPEWTFVLAGPSTRAGRAPLRRLPNVHLTGPVPYPAVPDLLRTCDVGLIPYRLGGLVDYVHPKKCFEYLALGKPVVATPLPALSGLSDPAGGAVRLAAGPARFAAAIAAALPAAACPRAAARRRAVALDNTWAVRGNVLRPLLDELLAAS